MPLLRISLSSQGSSNIISITDSLAICEFLAESQPQLPLWPENRKLRALAKCAVAEMHAGFLHVRNCFPTNFVGSYTGNIPVTAPAGKEIERILTNWDHSRMVTSETLRDIGEKDDGFLFGRFGIADAFFWPVLWVCCFCSFPNLPQLSCFIFVSPSEPAYSRILANLSFLCHH